MAGHVNLGYDLNAAYCGEVDYFTNVGLGVVAAVESVTVHYPQFFDRKFEVGVLLGTRPVYAVAVL